MAQATRQGNIVAKTKIKAAPVEGNFVEIFSKYNAHDAGTDGIHGLPAGSAVVGTTDTQTLTNKTLTAPKVSNLVDMQHDHGTPDKGGQISKAGMPATTVHTDQPNAFLVAPSFPQGQPLIDPSVNRFINANHDHSTAEQGGMIPLSSIISGSFVTTPSFQLRVVTGRVLTTSGSIVGGSGGASVLKTGVGQFTLVFSQIFSTVPVTIVSMETPFNSNQATISTIAQNQTTVLVTVRLLSGTLVDIDFNFIALG